MTQAYQETFEMKMPEVKATTKNESAKNEVDELLGDLNPRYFEESYNLEKAKQKVFSSSFYASYQL